MSFVPSLKGLFYLFGCSLEVYSNFQLFVDVAEVITDHLSRAVIMFGHGWNGLITIAKSRCLVFPVREVRNHAISVILLLVV